jgi:type IV pilus assembly protein PilC
MLTYNYVARELSTGNKITADVQAENESAAARLLTERGLAPLEIHLKKEAKGVHAYFSRVRTKHKVVFSRQLATLINAGLPLIQSLTNVQQQTQNARLKEVTGDVISDVESGITLADAMAKHPATFDRVYVSLVAAGETSGTLDKSLERLAAQQEKDADILSKIRGALIYPAIIMVVLVAVVVFMVTTVLPQVETLYKGLPGVQLPLVTRILLVAAHFILHFWWLLILLLVGFGVFGYRWARSPAGSLVMDRFKLNAPVISPLYAKLYMARFARTSSTLIASGVPMIRMLEVTAEAVGNRYIADTLIKAIEQVKSGKALSVTLQGAPHFPDLVPSMLSIGEKSGTMEAMLERLADYYERELDNQIKQISTAIEPVLMIVVGLIAMFVVAAVLLPIYSLAGKSLIRTG